MWLKMHCEAVNSRWQCYLEGSPEALQLPPTFPKTSVSGGGTSAELFTLMFCDQKLTCMIPSPPDQSRLRTCSAFELLDVRRDF